MDLILRIIDYVLRRKDKLIALGLLSILNLILFSRSLGDFFLSDDFDWLNLTRQGQDLWAVLSGNYYGLHAVGGTFRPMVNLIFSIENWLFGLHQIGYHIVSLGFHIGTAFLVYLVAAKLFTEHALSQRIAFLAAVLFSIMPNHTEAVVWVAAVGDPMSAFFYLLSFYFYLCLTPGDRSPKLKILSLVFFVLALLSKEIAVILPFTLLGYEMIFRRNYSFKKNASKLWLYFAILAGYLIWRFWAIGLLFGYYGRASLSAVAHLKDYLKTFINLALDMFMSGSSRVQAANYLFSHKYILAILGMLTVIVTVSYFRNKNRNRKIEFLIYFWLINAAIVLPLMLGIFNDEGQRYGYLPSVAVAVILGWLLVDAWGKEKRAAYLFGFILISGFYFNAGIQLKQWSVSADISENIYHQLPKFDYQVPEKTYFIGLPNNYENAQLMRNGAVQALQLQNVDASKVERVPIFTVLNESNFNQPLYESIELKDDGFLATAKDGQFIITGNATEDHQEYLFELWGYNYATTLSDHIRLYFKGDIVEKFNDGRAQVIYYDEGQLKKLEL